jgi:hypothetical protein
MPYSPSDERPGNRRPLTGLPPPPCRRSVTSVANSDSEFLWLRLGRAEKFVIPTAVSRLNRAPENISLEVRTERAMTASRPARSSLPRFFPA